MTAPDTALQQDRVDLRGKSLRQHAAKGTIINSAFQIGLALLGLVRRVGIAAFLTREEFGIWGIIVTTLMTLAWLKQLGVADKYIQQNEPDQEAAYQKAFTIEFLLSAAFFVVICLILPIYAVAYGRTDIILPGLLLGLSVPVSAFESPTWITYRRMQFVRQRTLGSIDPVAALLVTMALGVLGAGYWALVIGALAGSVLGGLVCTITSPYPVRFKFDRRAVRDYASFSWPLFGYQLCNLVVVQGIVLVGARSVGIAGVGTIGLVSSISAFADRVDGIVSDTIYPAICAVADRTELLFEAFVKSNRLALMWGMPFGVGLALFAGDLVHYLFGDRWQPAVGLLSAIGLIAGIRQVAFNWQIFHRAVNDTKPIFYVSAASLITFFVVMIPLMLTLGLTGYALGMAVVAVIQLVMRGYFLRRLFGSGFKLRHHFVRAIAPSVPAAGSVLLLRQVDGGLDMTASTLLELGVYALVTIAATWLFERDLIKEMLGYMRGRGGGVRTRAQAMPQAASPTPAQP
jgi:O-antigen/teichoic acid export membrane protein